MSQSSPSSRPLPPTISLRVDEQQRVLVLPGERATAFKPFPLPSINLSMHLWLASFAVQFMNGHGRCIAALLLLDTGVQRWLPPVVPRQTCDRDGSAWSLDFGDETTLANTTCVGGSFQTRRFKDANEASGCVPRLDGLHIVRQPTTSGAACFFLRYDGQSHIVPPDDLLRDDYEAALTKAASRMTFPPIP
jgi:hypothetical protein